MLVAKNKFTEEICDAWKDTDKIQLNKGDYVCHKDLHNIKIGIFNTFGLI